MTPNHNKADGHHDASDVKISLQSEWQRSKSDYNSTSIIIIIVAIVDDVVIQRGASVNRDDVGHRFHLVGTHFDLNRDDEAVRTTLTHTHTPYRSTHRPSFRCAGGFVQRPRPGCCQLDTDTRHHRRRHQLATGTGDGLFSIKRLMNRFDAALMTICYQQ